MFRWTGYGFLSHCPKQGDVYNFVWVNRILPARMIWFAKCCLYSKYTKEMTIKWICSIAIANKWLENKTACSLSFVLNSVTKWGVGGGGGGGAEFVFWVNCKQYIRVDWLILARRNRPMKVIPNPLVKCSVITFNQRFYLFFDLCHLWALYHLEEVRFLLGSLGLKYSLALVNKIKSEKK